MVELPQKEIGEQHDLRCLDRIVEFDRRVAERVAESGEGSLEEVHLTLLLCQLRIGIGEDTNRA